MPSRTIHRIEFYVEEGNGPTRQGERRHKPGFGPSPEIHDEVYEDLLSRAENLTAWLQYHWHNDHGTATDVQDAVDFVNLAVRLAGDAHDPRPIPALEGETP